MNIVVEIQKYAQQPLPTELLLEMLKGYRRPYDKITDLMQKGYLVQIRRGLYLPSELLSIQRPEPFLIANHVYGPSYVSLDAALFYWGMIPERVYEITSVTNRLAKTFSTKVGVFSYVHIPTSFFSFGMQQLVLTDRQTVLIASKEKAILDKIITSSGLQLRSKKQVLSYLVEDLRIEKDSLRNLNITKQSYQY
jgi:hypothetical protein